MVERMDKTPFLSGQFLLAMPGMSDPRFARAVIAIGGGWGTLSEVAFAMKRGTPVVSLGSFALDGVLAAGSPAEAVDLALGVTGTH